MSAPKHNRFLGESAEFERLLAESLSQAGWGVDRQPKFADGQLDSVAKYRGKKYVFELKVSSDQVQAPCQA
jgi:Holliday junction resolvase